MGCSPHSRWLTLVFCAALGPIISAQAPCSEFTNIGDGRRSVVYKYNPDAEEALCDFTLSEGRWYIFNTTRLAAIPEEDVVDFNLCGTYSPIFVKARDGDETYHEEARRDHQKAVQAPVCSNYIDLDGECDWSEFIQLQYCPNGDYFVYWLKKPTGCPMSYCTDDKPICDPGEYWDPQDQVCKPSYPSMYAPTLTGPYVIDSKSISVCAGVTVTVEQFAFDCNVGYEKPQEDDKARFEIYLTVNDEAVGEPVYATSMSPVHTFKEEDLKSYMGDMIGCQVSSYYENMEDYKSPVRPSNTHWIGIYGETITVDRDKEKSGTVHTISIFSTVPITCYHCRSSSAATCTCCKNGCTYTYQIGTEGSDLTKAGTCLLEITNNTIDSENGPFRVGEIKVAVHDDPDMNGAGIFSIEFTYMPMVPCQSPEIGGTIWDNYKINSAAVTIRESSYMARECKSLQDPHITSITGNDDLHSYIQGDVKLAKVLKPEEEVYMEIQARQYLCNAGGDVDREVTAACNCAVLVREGNSMLGIDACDPSKGFNKDNVRQIRYLRAVMEDGTVVEDGSTMFMDSTGLNYYIVMKSGMEVKIELSVYMDITVTFPKDYVTNDIDGMCNWVANRKPEEYRVDDDDSLFNKNPPDCFLWESLTEPALGCQCNKKDNDDSSNEEDDNELVCGSDTAAFIVGEFSPANLKESEYFCHYDEGKNNPLLKNNIYPAFRMTEQEKSDDFIDTADIYYNFEYDKNSGINFTISWPTKSGITEADARNACTEALHSSVAYTTCKELIKENMLTTSCSADIGALDDISYARNYISSMESMCLDTAVRQANVSSVDELRNDTLYNSVASDICPSQCNGKGNCVNGVCACNTGYIGTDCSVDSNAPPTLTGIYNNGSCDLTKKYCAKITVYVSNIYKSALLQCRYTAVPLIPTKESKVDVYFTNATFVNARQLNCPTPPTKLGVSYSYQLAITNDGILFSEELPYVIYDPTCVEQQNGVWTQKTGTCLHENVCYIRDQRQSDENCFVCTSDDQSVNQWTNTTQWQGWTNCSRSCDMGVIEHHYGCPGVSYEVELRSCHLKNCTDRPEYENEGVQLTFYEGDSLLESLYQSDQLFNEVARAVNDYCSNNTEECCPQMNPGANADVDITTGWLIYFDTGDPHVYVDIFFMRLLVTTEQANLERLCGLENKGVVFKMADTPLFVRSQAVVSAVTLAKSDIEQALGISIGSIN